MLLGLQFRRRWRQTGWWCRGMCAVMLPYDVTQKLDRKNPNLKIQTFTWTVKTAGRKSLFFKKGKYYSNYLRFNFTPAPKRMLRCSRAAAEQRGSRACRAVGAAHTRPKNVPHRGQVRVGQRERRAGPDPCSGGVGLTQFEPGRVFRRIVGLASGAVFFGAYFLLPAAKRIRFHFPTITAYHIPPPSAISSSFRPHV